MLEQRSFGSAHNSQIDTILDDLTLSWIIYGCLEKVQQARRSDGYSHVLVNRRCVDFLTGSHTGFFHPAYQAAFDLVVQDHLKLLDITDDGL